MTASLKDRIAKQIRASAPIPLAEFMHWCMADPGDGYYANREAIGAKGDFITAPEISQMFGEMIGIWAVERWEELGRPTPFNLVELGPGKGTLMGDLLRVGKAVPEFVAAARVRMVETSDRLVATQKHTLSEFGNVTWHKSIQEISDDPAIIIANEFLDVLPVRQYVKTGDEWREHAIGINGEDELVWTLGTGILEKTSLPENADDEPEGAIFEISTIRESFIANTAEILKTNSGAALFIDYGHVKSGFGDTVQALRAHGYTEILKEPGQADLTAHVDFEALQKVAESNGVNTKPLTTQGEFLLDLGLLERAGQLGRDQSDEIQESLARQAERLALPEEMGNLFKVMEFGKGKD